MPYTTIKIDAPNSAVPEDFVEARVEVFTVEALNLHRLHVIIGYEDAEGWEKSPVTLADVYRPFQYQKFDCMFKMRYCKVCLYVYTYYETLAELGVWHFDNLKEHLISVAEAPPPPPPPPGYWITVAEGDTIAELQANAVGKYIADEFRYVIKTRGAPSWLLKGAAWIVNQLTAPLNAIGVDLEYVGIKDGTIYIYMHGSPVVFSTTALIIACLGCFTIIAVWAYKYMIQQKLTKQQYYKLKEAEVKADVIEAIKDLPPEVQDTLLQLWEAGIEPEEEGIDWEKYLKWGLIAGGVILGGSVLIPPLVRALRGHS